MDLPALSSPRARSLASVLSDILLSVHFDAVNRDLRAPQYGGDYDVRPFPLPGSTVDVPAMKVRLRQAVKASPSDSERTLARRIQYAFMFFMFGEALQREPIEELFGDTHGASIDEGLSLGLFVNLTGQAIRMNGLSLFSRRLPNGEVIHLFADTPPQFQHRTTATPRVYIGADSYELMNRISSVSESSGCCVEMGSGSGVQLVSALRQHPRITRAIGKERDRRAVNISLFNAALNGLVDRMAVVESDAVLGSAMDGRPVAFAMTNPPFLAMPSWIDINAGDRPLVEGVMPVRETDRGPQADLRTLFPEAGWGGEDGLDVTKHFIDQVQPILSPGIPFIIYSQFAGDIDGPTRVRAYAERVGLQFTFEPLMRRRALAREAAITVARLIVAAVLAKRHPQRMQSMVRKGSPDHKLLLTLSAGIEQSYHNQAITHFHDGFAVLTKAC